MRRGTAVVVVTLLTVPVFSGSAAGLSCPALDPRNDLDVVDAVFRGEIVKVGHTIKGTVYTARVDLDVRRNLPEVVTFLARRSIPGSLFPNAPFRIGSPIAIGLHTDGKRWHGLGICGPSYLPAEVERAVEPLPRTRPGRIRFILTGILGEVTTVALGASGQIRAYGVGGGIRPALCPGSRWMVEFVRDPMDGRMHLVRRKLASFHTRPPQRLNRIRLGDQSVTEFRETSCGDPTGRLVFGVAVHDEGVLIARIRDGVVRVVAVERGGYALEGDTALLIDDRGRLVRLDLRTRERSTLGTSFARARGIALSPARAMIAVVERRGRSWILTMRDSEAPDRVVDRVQLPASADQDDASPPRIRWLDEERIGVAMGSDWHLVDREEGLLETYTHLETFFSSPISTGRSVVALRSDEDVTELVRVHPSEDAGTLRVLDSPHLAWLLKVPGGDSVRVHQLSPPNRLPAKGPVLTEQVSYGLDIRLAWALLFVATGSTIAAVRIVLKRMRIRPSARAR